MSANKAAYLSNIINTPASSSTCLRLIKKTDIPINQNCKAIGIDDWAKRKGVNYGSIIVDSQTHKTIDLISSRSESDIIAWLSQNPSIEYVTRDRAAFYASAITKALPQAKQIADKFHLIKNLSDAIFEDIKSLSSMIRRVLQDGIHLSCSKPITQVEQRSEDLIYQHETQRRRAKLALFQELKNQGLNNTAIARRTGSNRDTVRSYLKNGYPKVKSKATLNYDDYLDVIHEMCNNQLNPSAMFRKLKELGFKGCIKSFTGWFDSRFPDYKFK
ncbi:MAG: transposase [Bacteroidales bacterium]